MILYIGGRLCGKKRAEKFGSSDVLIYSPFFRWFSTAGDSLISEMNQEDRTILPTTVHIRWKTVVPRPFRKKKCGNIRVKTADNPRKTVCTCGKRKSAGPSPGRMFFPGDKSRFSAVFPPDFTQPFAAEKRAFL